MAIRPDSAQDQDNEEIKRLDPNLLPTKEQVEALMRKKEQDSSRQTPKRSQ